MLSQKLNTLRLISLSLMTSIVVYGVIMVMVAPAEPAVQGEQVQLYLAVFAVVSMGTAVAIPLIRRLMMGNAALAGDDPTAIIRDEPADETILPGEIAHAAAKYQTGTIVGMALAESIALYGLVFAFMTGRVDFGAVFLLVGLCLQAIQFPRVATFRTLLSGSVKRALQLQERGGA